MLATVFSTSVGALSRSAVLEGQYEDGENNGGGEDVVAAAAAAAAAAGAASAVDDAPPFIRIIESDASHGSTRFSAPRPYRASDLQSNCSRGGGNADADGSVREIMSTPTGSTDTCSTAGRRRVVARRGAAAAEADESERASFTDAATEESGTSTVCPNSCRCRINAHDARSRADAAASRGTPRVMLTGAAATANALGSSKLKVVIVVSSSFIAQSPPPTLN